MFRFRALSILVVGTLMTALVSCGKGGEQDDLAKAQSCLDHVQASNPQTATQCLQYINKYSSVQANNLKCAIYLTSGGLIENKIVQAYGILSDNSQQNKAASFMAAISLDVPDATSAYNTATTADSYCRLSGTSGLASLSSIILAGTTMKKSIFDLGLGGSFDINNPSSVNTAVQSMITQCAVATPPAGCPSTQTLGSSVTTIATVYCGQPSANSNVCTSVNGAIASAGGSSSSAGAALLCYLKNQKYNAQTGACY